MEDNNYYIIHGWMTNRLHLKGIALSIFAIIYGFSQDGESEYKGSRQYLADFVNSTKPTIDKALKELVESNYIIKISNVYNNVIFNSYKVNIGYINNFTSGKEILLGGKETLLGGGKESLLGGKETLHNNNNIKNINNNNNKYNKYGNYGRITLKDNEYEKLCNDFGKDYINEVINVIDEYVELNNNKNKYSNFNLVIRKAIREKWSLIQKISLKPFEEKDNRRPDDLLKEVDELLKEIEGL